MLWTATLTLGKGSCSLKAKQLKEGTYRVYAHYGGDANHLTSATLQTTVKVTQAAQPCAPPAR